MVVRKTRLNPAMQKVLYLFFHPLKINEILLTITISSILSNKIKYSL